MRKEAGIDDQQALASVPYLRYTYREFAAKLRETHQRQAENRQENNRVRYRVLRLVPAGLDDERVLDTRTKPHFPHHFQIIFRPLFKALGFQQLILGP